VSDAVVERRNKKGCFFGKRYYIQRRARLRRIETQCITLTQTSEVCTEAQVTEQNASGNGAQILGASWLVFLFTSILLCFLANTEVSTSVCSYIIFLRKKKLFACKAPFLVFGSNAASRNMYEHLFPC
jgi:hypothetical protein